MDEQAPIKNKVIKINQVPFMNGDLRRTINVKICTGENLLTRNSIINFVITLYSYPKHVQKIIPINTQSKVIEVKISRN